MKISYILMIISLPFNLMGSLLSDSTDSKKSEDDADLALFLSTKDYASVNNHLSHGRCHNQELLKQHFSICLAAKNEQWHLVSALLNANADIAVCNDHLTPLFCAVRSAADCHWIVKDLLLARSDPNTTEWFYVQ